MSLRANIIDARKEAPADGWFTPGKFALILGALIFVCFPLVVTGSETFFFRDFGCFGYPLAFGHREAFWRGEWPLWNPYNNCGLPFLAQWNTLTLYPLSLFYLIFPLSWSLGMFCLGHLFLGGMGMYFLARRWTGNGLAAAVAGAVFAFNGLTWHALMWPNNSAALGWMPWVVLALERAWREGERRVILAALAGAMQMLAGAPEIIILTWLTAGTLWLVELTDANVPRVRMVARFFLALGLVVALAAVQLLPFLDLLQHSQRGTAFGDSQWAMPLTGWANYLMPLFHTFPQKGVFSQYGQFWTASYYMGVGTVALAGMAVWRLRDRRAWVLAGLAIFGLIMSFGDGGGLYAWLKHAVPVIGFMRFPIKFVVLVTFALPLLAAFGLNWFQRLLDSQWARERKNLLRLGAMLLAAIVLVTVWEWLAPLSKDDRVAVLENAVVRILFLAMSLGCVAVLRQVAEFKLQRLLRVGLVLVVWFDVFTHAPNLSPTVERGVYEPDSVREYFKWNTELRPGESRAMASPASAIWISLHSVADPGADVNGRRLGMYGNYNLLDHTAKVDGIYSLELSQMSRLNQRLYSATNEWPKLEDFMGVARVTNPTNMVDWVARDTFLPLITGGQEPVFAEDDVAMRGVLAAEFAPDQRVFLEPAARAEITAQRAEVKIISRSFAAQQVSAEVEVQAPAMVVVAQAFYHCWQAYLDGKPVRLWRANYAFQAVEVPAGRHELRLVYEDKAFHAGAMISLVAVIVAGAGWFWIGQKGKKIQVARESALA